MNRRIRQILLPLTLLVLLLASALTVSAAVDESPKLRQTRAYNTTLMMEWDYGFLNNDNGFTLVDQTLYVSTSQKTIYSKPIKKIALDKSVRKAKVTGLKQGSRYYATILYRKKNKKEGGIESYDITDEDYNYIPCSTLPAKLTGLTVTFGKNHKQLLMKWYDPSVAPSGYNFQHMSPKGTIIEVKKDGKTIKHSGRTTDYWKWYDYQVPGVQQFRVRAYYDLYDLNDKLIRQYGPWSYKWIVPEPSLYGGSCYIVKKTGALKLAWQKLSGVQKYEIYISKKPSSNYQKVATVSAPTNTATIKKLNGYTFKPGITYYVKIKSISARGTSALTYATPIKTAK